MYQGTIILIIVLCGPNVIRGQDDVVVSSWPTPTDLYHHKVELDEEGRFYLFWSIEDKTATFEVHAKTHGWVGLGFSTNGAMKGADIVVGWIKDGETYFTDRHGIGNERPVLDDQQDYKLITGTENDEFTIFKFSREFETCDPMDFVIKDGTMYAIFAWNDDKPGSAEEFEYHGAGRRGTRAIMLLGAVKRAAEDEKSEELKSFQMTVQNVVLPPERTYYHCRLMALPKMDKKHHIVKVKPIVTPGNEGVLHHIVAYFCYGDITAEEYGRKCWEGRMPENATDCNTIAHAWAVGGDEFIFPTDAGLSVGDTNDPAYFHLEMHYDNPELKEGFVDSSGFEFRYTDNLRPHDTGILLLGHTIWWPPMIIPPNAENFRIDSYCGMSCTNNIPQDGIKVYGVFPHTHLVGTGVFTKHIRDGVELPELYRDDNYDFNYQQLRALADPPTILPGDEFITSCIYNTKNRDKPTYGGPGTDNEMCFNFVMYYPRMGLTSCVSQTQGFYPWYQLIMERAMAGKVYINPNDDEEDTIDYLEKLEWVEADVQHMQTQIDRTHGFQQSCIIDTSKEGVFGGGGRTFEKVIGINKPYVAESKCPTVIVEPSAATSPRGHLVGLMLMMVLAIAM